MDDEYQKVHKLKEGETYNKCNEKTGYVFLPNKIISLKNLPMQIIVIPIYLILTKVSTTACSNKSNIPISTNTTYT